MNRKLIQASLPFLPVAFVLAAPGAHAAPPYVAETTACRVSLAQISYDDPDADDAEFLVLAVDRLASPPRGATGASPPAPATGPCSPDAEDAADSGTAALPEGGGTGDPGTANEPLLLGHCGLDRLELVSGGSGACDTYRSIPLAGVPVPADGRVVLCATDSVLAPSGVCDLMAAGRAALRNGWLQNGPADGLRFVGTAGAYQELAYEGRPECFSPAALTLPEEKGFVNVGGTPFDDVAVRCGSEYSLRPFSFEALREPNSCATPSMVKHDAGAAASPREACPSGACGSGGSGSTPGGGEAPNGGEASTWVPELSPEVAPRPGTGTDLGGLWRGDAAAYQLPTGEAPEPPPAPGCTLSRDAGLPRGSASSEVLAGLLLVGSAWRRRVKPPQRQPASRRS
jgi:hypothetical protein